MARYHDVAAFWVLALLLAALLVGAGFYAGIQKAEGVATEETNAMMRIEERLYRIHAATGRFPAPSFEDYERFGMTMSDLSDTAVAYYSGVEQTHLLTLHLRGGVLLTSRH